MYDETRARRIYAGADALLVPSPFEPCGLTQLIAMDCGTIPIVRETGGLKHTVEPYNMCSNTGNGFTLDRYDAGLLLDAINRAKTLYFESRLCWNELVQRDMEKDLSWENSAKFDLFRTCNRAGFPAWRQTAREHSKLPGGFFCRFRSKWTTL